MTFGFSENARRRKRRLWGRFFRVVFAFTVVLVIGAFMYRLGLDESEEEVATLKQSIADTARDELRQGGEVLGLQKDLADARRRVAEVEKRYARDVPTGPAQGLAVLVGEKLDAGVAPQRLAFLIGAAKDKPQCDGEAVTKRFIVQTPLFQGANGAVSFTDNSVTVTGEGEPAQSDNGKPEAWFDPAKPITVRFTLVGGESFDVAGKLPLHHSVVIGDAEHRFSMIQGARGFLNVVGERCRFP